ncbi:MAG: adenosylmethionine decarboxylase [Planctomyces sp.]|nr:adenosylmethionine decarboxylase [Planctomyces sp.]
MIPDSGAEWIVDAAGCDPARLSDPAPIEDCCEAIIRAMGLHVVGHPQFRAFPAPGGVTALYLLSESHLSVHTFPEYGLVALNVYCCRPHTPPDWLDMLGAAFGATEIAVRELPRGRRALELSERALRTLEARP